MLLCLVPMPNHVRMANFTAAHTKPMPTQQILVYMALLLALPNNAQQHAGNRHISGSTSTQLRIPALQLSIAVTKVAACALVRKKVAACVLGHKNAADSIAVHKQWPLAYSAASRWQTLCCLGIKNNFADLPAIMSSKRPDHQYPIARTLRATTLLQNAR